MPMPPSWASVMAMGASQTVSMLAATTGMSKVRLRLS